MKLAIKMKQKYRYPSTSRDTSVILMIYIIMGIPATIEILSSFRSSFQLHEIKNRIKKTTKKPKRKKFNCTQNIFLRTFKQVYKGISIQI